MQKLVKKFVERSRVAPALLVVWMLLQGTAFGQGVTTASMSGIVTDQNGAGLIGANVVVVHEPTGTRYGASTRSQGQYNIPNMRVGGPYSMTVDYVGYEDQTESNIFLRLGQDTRIDFALAEQAIAGDEVLVTAETDDVLNSGRTGAATQINQEQISQLPSVQRSTRDLTRLDPRSDGNYSFGGKNWLYNSVSLDGSYFNNAFGLDDPAPGGQSNAEPVPFDAVEQVQVSIAPFDVREGGFTGAGVNTVTKSGSNTMKGSLYSFTRNEDFIGNTVRGQDVVANPDLSYMQSGFTASGPIITDKLFFFVNGEVVRRDDPGTNFVASDGGEPGFGESRVTVSDMNMIRNRLIDAYGYDPGEYQGYIHETNSDKLLAKLDYNINDNNNLSLRYNYLDAFREQPPHPFAISFFNTGRGPNASTLPFQNSGYAINNELHSVALELNSRGNSAANRFFASYNRFRDFRTPFSGDFPTIEIGQDGVGYTTAGHEPFSIHNILDQDVLQITNNLSIYSGNQVFTFGINYEHYSFFNSFNLFRHGLMFLPDEFGGSLFESVDDFMEATDPANPNQWDPFALIGSGPFKGENIDVGQVSLYAQDEILVNPKFNMTFGMRIDVPVYFTTPVDNPFSRGLAALDAYDNPTTVDQSELPAADPLLSPRIGFNWDPSGDRTTQVRGGTGVFTGRVPFVWIGNVISNPGANPNLFPTADPVETSEDAVLQQTFDLNAMTPDFKWPQVWNTNIAIDKELGNGFVATVEGLYGKDINAIVMLNTDLVAPSGRLADGRPYFGGAGSSELNPDGAGAYVLDNTSEGYNYSLTAQLRKRFSGGGIVQGSYTFLEAKSQLASTEIASVLWQNNPVQGDPNRPNLSYSQFGARHRFVGAATFSKQWTGGLKTHFGLFAEVTQGNRYTAAGGNRYSFIYAGDVNGDGQPGNDLIYIPTGSGDIELADPSQWDALNAFIEQDDYLSQNRGQIAERFGALNPWFSNIDMRILQDFGFDIGNQRHTFQLSVDVLNVANLLNDEWGVRKVLNPAAAFPLATVDADGDNLPDFVDGRPVLNFSGATETYIDDPGQFSRWQVQVGLRYFFE